MAREIFWDGSIYDVTNISVKNENARLEKAECGSSPQIRNSEKAF